MKSILFLFLSALLLVSCESEKTKAPKQNKFRAVETKEDPSSVTEARDENVSEESRGGRWIKIRFPDVTITVQSFDVGWDSMYFTGNDSVYSVTSDTAYLDLMPGEWFEGKKFKIDQKQFDEIKLYEKITYHVGFTSKQDFEVPFCVMSGWKSWISKWNEIRFKDGVAKFDSNENKINPVIDFTVDEFKAAVKDHCGEEWYEEIKNSKSKDKLRSEIFTSEYLFRIVLRNSTTGKTIEKYILFNTPTSC